MSTRAQLVCAWRGPVLVVVILAGWAIVGVLPIPPAVLAYFFKSGPFAWHGMFVFWLGTAVYGAWAPVMGLTLRRAVLDQHEADPDLGAEDHRLKNRHPG